MRNSSEKKLIASCVLRIMSNHYVKKRVKNLMYSFWLSGHLAFHRKAFIECFYNTTTVFMRPHYLDVSQYLSLKFTSGEHIQLITFLNLGILEWRVGSGIPYTPLQKKGSFPLTHFSLMSHFYTPWKRQKIIGFPTFSGGIEMWHWVKIGLGFLQ